MINKSKSKKVTQKKSKFESKFKSKFESKGPLDEYKIVNLKNGIPVIMTRNSNQTSVTIVIFVKTGSNWETLELNGMSHLLEHLFFRGTSKRPTQNDISKEFEEYGAKSNAFTGREMTCYHTKVNSDNYLKIIEIMGDIMTNSLYSQSDIELEKKIVINELKQHYSKPDFQISNEFYSNFFKGHPIAKPVIGKGHLIKKFDRFKLMAFLYLHYQPKNLVISVAGNFKSYITLENHLNLNFGSNFHHQWKSDSTFFKREYERLNLYKSQWIKIMNLMSNRQNFSSISNKINYHTNKQNLDHTFVVIGFPGVSFKDPTKYRLELLAHILGVGMSSRLFDKIRSKEGLVYSIKASHRAHDYNGVFMIKYSCNHNLRNQIKILKLIKRELDLIQTILIDNEEYEKIINKFINSVKMAQENSYENCFHYGFQLTKGSDIKTYSDLIEIYKNISPGDLKINAQLYLDYDKILIQTISPIKIYAETYQKIFQNKTKNETKNENKIE